MKKKIMIMIATICCCIGSLNMSMVPAHASDDKHACPVGLPKEFTDRLESNPYWLDISFASSHNGGSVGCNGTEHWYYMSNKPIVLTKGVGNDGSIYYTFGVGVTAIKINRTFTNDPPTFAVTNAYRTIFSYYDNYTYVTNHDITLKDTGDIVFPKPPAPVDPVKPDVSLGEEWWTVILTRIIPLVPGIAAVIGGMVLLILLWRYLRRSVKSSMV